MSRIRRFETKLFRIRNTYPRSVLILPLLLLIPVWIYSRDDRTQAPAPLKITPQLLDLFRQKLNSSHRNADIERVWGQIIEKFIPLPLDSFVGSHAVPLLASILLTNESILELGCGNSSTPMLHNISFTFNRHVLSVDSNKDCLSAFSSIMSTKSLHQFQHTLDWSAIGNDRQWSVVFVDNTPEKRRIHDIIKYAYRSQLIVLHDSESAAYMYDKASPFFPYQYRYQYLQAYTEVWSTTNAELIEKVRYLSELTVQWQLPRMTIKKKDTV
ncbi:unnamed protein product [Adineta ricciae]|uniref:Methyltransferase domain-containing protein n=1 Tax=Adineta ricciae TaxID=249248 RepID=A0A814Z6E2_ADIRI|nr:unnamed protein product [Adineta ricciae]CAF1239465.1 unnamed protein product [Adineta ricciae]